MSTLKVTNIQDTAGGNSSTSEEIYSGRAKAWVNFNGVGTVAIRDDYNINSIADNGTGNYNVLFSNAMTNSNYTVASQGWRNNGAMYYTWLRQGTTTPQSTTSFALNSGTPHVQGVTVAAIVDIEMNQAMVFGRS